MKLIPSSCRWQAKQVCSPFLVMYLLLPLLWQPTGVEAGPPFSCTDDTFTSPVQIEDPQYVRMVRCTVSSMTVTFSRTTPITYAPDYISIQDSTISSLLLKSSSTNSGVMKGTSIRIERNKFRWMKVESLTFDSQASLFLMNNTQADLVNTQFSLGLMNIQLSQESKLIVAQNRLLVCEDRNDAGSIYFMANTVLTNSFHCITDNQVSCRSVNCPYTHQSPAVYYDVETQVDAGSAIYVSWNGIVAKRFDPIRNLMQDSSATRLYINDASSTVGQCPAPVLNLFIPYGSFRCVHQVMDRAVFLWNAQHVLMDHCTLLYQFVISYNHTMLLENGGTSFHVTNSSLADVDVYSKGNVLTETTGYILDTSLWLRLALTESFNWVVQRVTSESRVNLYIVCKYNQINRTNGVIRIEDSFLRRMSISECSFIHSEITIKNNIFDTFDHVIWLDRILLFQKSVLSVINNDVRSQEGRAAYSHIVFDSVNSSDSHMVVSSNTVIPNSWAPAMLFSNCHMKNFSNHCLSDNRIQCYQYGCHYLLSGQGVQYTSDCSQDSTSTLYAGFNSYTIRHGTNLEYYPEHLRFVTGWTSGLPSEFCPSPLLYSRYIADGQFHCFNETVDGSVYVVNAMSAIVIDQCTLNYPFRVLYGANVLFREANPYLFNITNSVVSDLYVKAETLPAKAIIFINGSQLWMRMNIWSDANWIITHNRPRLLAIAAFIAVRRSITAQNQFSFNKLEFNTMGRFRLENGRYKCSNLIVRNNIASRYKDVFLFQDVILDEKSELLVTHNHIDSSAGRSQYSHVEFFRVHTWNYSNIVLSGNYIVPNQAPSPAILFDACELKNHSSHCISDNLIHCDSCSYLLTGPAVGYDSHCTTDSTSTVYFAYNSVTIRGTTAMTKAAAGLHVDLSLARSTCAKLSHTKVMIGSFLCRGEVYKSAVVVIRPMDVVIENCDFSYPVLFLYRERTYSKAPLFNITNSVMTELVVTVDSGFSLPVETTFVVHGNVLAHGFKFTGNGNLDVVGNKIMTWNQHPENNYFSILYTVPKIEGSGYIRIEGNDVFSIVLKPDPETVVDEKLTFSGQSSVFIVANSLQGGHVFPVIDLTALSFISNSVLMVVNNSLRLLTRPGRNRIQFLNVSFADDSRTLVARNFLVTAQSPFAGLMLQAIAVTDRADVCISENTFTCNPNNLIRDCEYWVNGYGIHIKDVTDCCGAGMFDASDNILAAKTVEADSAGQMNLVTKGEGCFNAAMHSLYEERSFDVVLPSLYGSLVTATETALSQSWVPTYQAFPLLPPTDLDLISNSCFVPYHPTTPSSTLFLEDEVRNVTPTVENEVLLETSESQSPDDLPRTSITPSLNEGKNVSDSTNTLPLLLQPTMTRNIENESTNNLTAIINYQNVTASSSLLLENQTTGGPVTSSMVPSITSANNGTDPPSKKQTRVVESSQAASAMASVMSPTAAESIVATSTTSAALAGVANPAAATSAVRVGALIGALECNFDASSDFDPPRMLYPYFRRIGSTRSSNASSPEGGHEGDLIGAMCYTTLLFIVVPMVILYGIWAQLRTHHQRHRFHRSQEHMLRLSEDIREGDESAVEMSMISSEGPCDEDKAPSSASGWLATIQEKFYCPFVSVCIGYFLPSLFSACMLVLRHGQDTRGQIYCVLSLVGALLLICLPLYVVVLRFNREIAMETVLKTEDGTNGLISNGEEEGSESHRKEEDDGESKSKKQLLSTSNSSSFFFTMFKIEFSNKTAGSYFTETFISFFDGGKDMERLSVRLYFYEDVAVSCLLGMIDGWRPESGSCQSVAIAMLIVTLLHLLYLVIIRPYRTLVDKMFTALIAILQVGIALVVLLALSKQTFIEYLGYLVLAQSVIFFVQAVVVAYMLYRGYQKDKKKAAAEKAAQENVDTGKVDTGKGSMGNDGEQGCLTAPLLETSNPLEAQQEFHVNPLERR